MAKKTMAERILSKTAIRENGCVEWTASKDRAGYGHTSVNSKTKKAHRVVFEMFVSPIPEGMTLDHLCRNTSCVAPAHLEVVTTGENTLRGTSFSAINAKKIKCKNGHPFDETNTGVRTGGRRCRRCAVFATQRYQKKRRSE